MAMNNEKLGTGKIVSSYTMVLCENLAITRLFNDSFYESVGKDYWT